MGTEELIDKIRSAIPFSVGDYIWVDGYSDNLIHPAIVDRIIIEDKTILIEIGLPQSHWL